MIDNDYYYLTKQIRRLERKKNKSIDELLEIMKLKQKIEGIEAEKKIKNKRSVK